MKVIATVRTRVASLGHTIVMKVSCKKLVSMFLEICSVYKKLTDSIWKETCSLKTVFTVCELAATMPYFGMTDELIQTVSLPNFKTFGPMVVKL